MNLVALGDIAKIDRTTASKQESRTLPYVGLEHIEKDAGHFAPDFGCVPEATLATKFRGHLTIRMDARRGPSRPRI